LTVTHSVNLNKLHKNCCIFHFSLATRLVNCAARLSKSVAHKPKHTQLATCVAECHIWSNALRIWSNAAHLVNVAAHVVKRCTFD